MREDITSAAGRKFFDQWHKYIKCIQECNSHYYVVDSGQC